MFFPTVSFRPLFHTVAFRSFSSSTRATRSTGSNSRGLRAIEQRLSVAASNGEKGEGERAGSSKEGKKKNASSVFLSLCFFFCFFLK